MNLLRHSIILLLFSFQSILEGTETCVSWDFTVRNWVPKGCTTIVGDDDVIICKCNHLTNFAVLVVILHDPT